MRERGFTLLEMIVVLAILGLATALVAPATLRSIDSWQRKAAMDVLVDRALTGGSQGLMKVALTAPQNQTRRTLDDQARYHHQQ